MGLLYATFASKKERDQMRAFLLDQDLSLFEQSETGGFALQTGEEMGFAPRVGGTILGFKEDHLSQKIWALVAWMSVRSCMRHEGWAFVTMDGEEISVIETDRIHTEGALCVNDEGVLNSWIERELPVGPNPHIQRQTLLVLSRRYTEKTKRAKRVLVDKAPPKVGMNEIDTLEAEGLTEDA